MPEKLLVEISMESIRIPPIKTDFVRSIVKSLEQRGFRFSATTNVCKDCQLTAMCVYHCREEGKVVEGRLVCHSCGRSVPYHKWRPNHERYSHATKIKPD